MRPAAHNKREEIDRWGVMRRYRDVFGHWQECRHETVEALHAAMGLREPGGPSEPAVTILRSGSVYRPNRTVEIHLDSGEVLTVDRGERVRLPSGVHEARNPDGAAQGWLMISPGRCPPAPDRQQWGWALQLYSLRSSQSWGLGDFEDLRAFAEWSRKNLQTGLLLINPLGAPLPVVPQENSPYSPSSRQFLNPVHLRIEEIEGAAAAGLHLDRLAGAGHALNGGQPIDRDEVFRLKIDALERLWNHFAADEAFDHYRAERGKVLRQFAIFNSLAERHGGKWRAWPAAFRHPAGEAVRQFAAEHESRIWFHEWMQWHSERQLSAAARELPLMLDVPIGFGADGFDAWLWQDVLALDASVGAPPDEYNTEGQDWGLPPFIPHRLREVGFEPWRLTLRGMLRHARGLRIDHVMGLFRLYWIPSGQSPAAGAFVRYPSREMLEVLAIESQRAGALVVGEDLGTVEPGVRAELRRRNVLSYRLLWFESEHPRRWPRNSLGAVTTHDLFTVAGLWTGRDLEAQRGLNLHPNVKGTAAIRKRIEALTGLTGRAAPGDAIVEVHRVLRRSPSRLLTVTLEDALGVEERPNMPGTVDERPNWRLPLPKDLEAIRQDPLVQRIAEVMNAKPARTSHRKRKAAGGSPRRTRR